MIRKERLKLSELFCIRILEVFIILLRCFKSLWILGRDDKLILFKLFLEDVDLLEFFMDGNIVYVILNIFFIDIELVVYVIDIEEEEE